MPAGEGETQKVSSLLSPTFAFFSLSLHPDFHFRSLDAEYRLPRVYLSQPIGSYRYLLQLTRAAMKKPFDPHAHLPDDARTREWRNW
jgi:hypothetical protein